MLTISISLWSVLIGIILGIAISFFVYWIVDLQINKDNQWHVGFSKGWKDGCKFGEKFPEQIKH